jgi:hypothetical protein
MENKAQTLYTKKKKNRAKEQNWQPREGGKKMKRKQEKTTRSET